MGYNETEVWEMTPRKFKALVDAYVNIQQQMNGQNKGKNSNVSNGFIDTIPGW